MKSSNTTAVYQVKFTTFKYLCSRTVKTYVDFYTKCYVLLVATGISRVLGYFKSRYCVDAPRDFFFFFFFSPNEQRAGGGGVALPDFFFFFFRVQQTTSGIGHRVK